MPTNHISRLLLTMAIGSVGLLVAGCNGPGLLSSPQASGKSDAHAPSDADQTASAAREQAERLSAAMNPVATPTAAPGAPPVRWIEVRPLPARSEPASDDRGTPRTAVRPEPDVAMASAAPSPAERSRSAAEDRQALLEQLRQALRSGRDPAVLKAVAAASLSLADPQRKLDAADLTGLDAQGHELAQRYYDLLMALARESGAERESVAQSGTLLRVLGSITAPQAVRIRTLQLCKKVSGFGVYEAIQPGALLLGQTHRMILYVELDQFKSQSVAVLGGATSYQVKLTQEVALYNDADGFEVWRQPPVQVVDESRNQRRDFFVVQRIDLPPRLGAGKYVLKVRVIDQHGNSRDEISAPIQLVADQGRVVLQH